MMKIALIVMGMFVSATVHAEVTAPEAASGVESLKEYVDMSNNGAWQLYAKDADSARFYKKTIIHENGSVKAWVIMVLDDLAAKTTKYVSNAESRRQLRKLVILKEFKCGQEKARDLRINEYNAGGTFLGGTYPDDPVWGFVEPEEEGLYKEACPPPGKSEKK